MCLQLVLHFDFKVRFSVSAPPLTLIFKILLAPSPPPILFAAGLRPASGRAPAGLGRAFGAGIVRVPVCGIL